MMVSFKATFNLVHGSVFGKPGLLTNAVFSCGWSCTISAGLQIILLRRGLQHHKKCLLCDQEEETINHLLVSSLGISGLNSSRNLDYRTLLPSWLSLPLKFGGADLVRLPLVRIGRLLIP
jgi:hypothetical protein